MALVTEDGTGLADAESYGSLTAANTYWTQRTGTKAATRWAAATDPKKEAALRAATEWLDARYYFRGAILKTSQALAWPRTSVIDSEGRATSALPLQIVRATFQLAAEHLRRPLDEVLDRGGQIASQSVAGVVSVAYETGAPAERTFAFVDGLLADLIEGLRAGAGRDSVQMELV